MRTDPLAVAVVHATLSRMAVEETRVSRFSRDDAQVPDDACLVVIHAPARRLLGVRISLRREIVIGRDPGCELVLEADDVSRRHARIAPSGASHAVEDLGSTNGTFLKDTSLSSGTGPRLLTSGDQITVGSVVLKYLSGGDVEALYHTEIRRLAEEDPLTGLVHKGGFGEAIQREVARARRQELPLALALIDIDHFKKVNDTHGHLAGDQVLRDLAALLRPMVRAEQLLARIGGEELALLLSGTALAGARAFAEKIRASVEAHPFGYEGARIPVTVSIGVAELCLEDSGPDALVRRADERLYAAKRAGRNRVAA